MKELVNGASLQEERAEEERAEERNDGREYQAVLTLS